MRQIRIEVKLGFDDEPAPYEKMKYLIGELDFDEVVETFKEWARSPITELDELRVNDDADDD